MKKLQLFLLAALVPLDYIMLVLGASAAYYLRYTTYIQSLRPIIFDLPYMNYLPITLIVSLFGVGIFAWMGLYTSHRQSFVKELSLTFQAVSLTLIGVILYLFFIRENFASRFIVLFAYIFSTFTVIFGRILLRKITHTLYRNPRHALQTVLIGANTATDVLSAEFRDVPNYGMHVAGTYKTIDAFLQQPIACDQIIVTAYNTPRTKLAKLIDYSFDNHIHFKYVAGDFEARLGHTQITSIGGIPIVEMLQTPLAGWGKILKRLLDILGAIFGIIIFSPLMIVTALLVKLDSKGPILADTPHRAGQYGNPFRFLKFRSMYVGAHKDQAKLQSERDGLFKMKDDPRITRIGKFIRKTSIDELPQFFNVLFGQMSLVGPRPHYPEEYTPEQLKVLMIKPGITGISQISGRSDLSFEHEVNLDLSYIENWSIWVDLLIIVKTPIILITRMKSAV
jgi:exopolysaccharide biosynthesis polyprenyl glycosylphosphotransferase